MYYTIFYKWAVRSSTLRAQRQNLAINPSRISQINYSTLPSTNNPIFRNTLSAEYVMEFSQLQETLDEMWETWSREESKESIAVLSRNQVPQVNNALVFRFVIKKSIGIKDLEAALNSIWRPGAPVKVYAV